MDTKRVKKVCKTEARKAVKGHEKKMHAKRMSSGGGIKIRGTGAATKGTRATGPMA